MKIKSLFVLFILSVVLSNSSIAASVSSFVINASNLLNVPNAGSNNVVNLNATGNTSITSVITITKTTNEVYSLTFSLGTVTVSGQLFAFGGTATLNNNNDGDTNGSNHPGIYLNSTINTTQPVLNKLVLLVSSNGGPYTLYSGANHYITNKPIVPQPFYRYLNTASGFHLYTINQAEVKADPNWHSESQQGQVYNQQSSGLVPLYRYYNTNGDHFYTLNQGSYPGYTSENYSAFVYSTQVSNTIPLYEYSKPNLNNHFYTISYNELGAGGNGFTYIGIVCYVLPN